MKPIEYLARQMALEGIQVIGDHWIAPARPGGEDVPLLLLARTSDGALRLFVNRDLPIALRDRLAVPDRQGFSADWALEVMRQAGIPATIGRYRTYVCPESFGPDDGEQVACYSPQDPKVVAFGFHGLADEVFAIECSGQIVSACMSSRQASQAAEAWVFTHPAYRLRGLAQQVVRAWAQAMRHAGRTPFYSHHLDNTNSARLARRLGLTEVFDEIGIERET